MERGDQSIRARLSTDVEPELRRQIKVAAATRDLSVREYVLRILRQALAMEATDSRDETGAWSRLSAAAFARDWESEEDSVYDDIRQG